jgi:hypothetical protein
MPKTPAQLCGRHADEDFADEETVFEDRPREAVLTLVK